MSTQSLTEAPSGVSAEPNAPADTDARSETGLTFDGAQALLRDRYQNDPAQLQASLDALHSQYTGAKVAAGTARIQQQANLGAAIDRVNAALTGGIDTPDKGQALVDQIRGDPAFAADPAARFDAYQAVRNHVDALASGAPLPGLGPEFADALARIARGEAVTKPTLLALQAQGAITPQAYGLLKDALADPAEARMTNAGLMAARAQLSSGGGDQDGDATFARDFLPTFLAQYQTARTAGKEPLDLLAPGSTDNILEPLVSLFGGQQTTADTSATAAGGQDAGTDVTPISDFTSHTPVPFSDNQGNAVPNFKGNPMKRPSDVDPELFVRLGREVAADPARAYARLFWFQHGGRYDLQRVGSDQNTTEAFEDFANVAIGLYGAAANLPEHTVLSIADGFAAIRSKFGRDAIRDSIYSHLRVENVYDVKKGYELFRSGQIGEAPGP